ncbi:hypothetical protein F4678DRAFT_459439 [Xylaria arbuscula]|nr:hypothetical protein F4678DRAFT_459439 [Xylaria arbuscula]
MSLFPQFTEGRVKASPRLTRKKKYECLRDSENQSPAEESSNAVFNFQIAPELGKFMTTNHNYLTTFTHGNCPDHRTSNPSFPDNCSGSDFVEIIPQSAILKERFSRWMEVCPGGCNEEKEYTTDGFLADSSSGDSFMMDNGISSMLYEHAREICYIMHPRKDHILEIVDARILWSDKSPIPAYFSPSRGNIVAHSSAATAGHLALIQARGHVDEIQVDFHTH